MLDSDQYITGASFLRNLKSASDLKSGKDNGCQGDW